MKFVLILLTVATMSQVSLAGVLGRFKRDAVVEGFESTMTFLKHLADATEAPVKQTLEKMPKTEAYATYREELEDYLEAFNDYKTKKGICFQKSTELLKKFDEMTDEYEKEDAPEEAKKVDELLNSFGSDELETEIEQYMEKMKKLKEKHEEEESVDKAVEGLKILALMFEVC